MRIVRRSALAVAFVLLGVTMLVGLPLSVRAATFIVNSTDDTTDGICAAVSGGCTLREAIEAAVAMGGRDTIRFDPSVFVYQAAPVRITLASDLPAIADPAGTVVDGAGASVRITGGAAIARGLVFASAAGAPLVKVTVANVSLETFAEAAILLCAGAYPNCTSEEVSGALIRNVFVKPDGGDGIVIQGGTIRKARVVDSVVRNAGVGIHLHGPQAIVGSRVQGTSVTLCTDWGILFQSTTQTGSAVVDSIVAQNGFAGIQIDSEGGAIVKSKVTNVVACGNGGHGVSLVAEEGIFGTTVSNLVASQNAASGVDLSPFGTGGVALKNVVADVNTEQGIDLRRPSTGTKITRASVVGNLGSGINTETATGLKLKDVIAADNLGSGVLLRAVGGSADRIHASANGGAGIALAAGGGTTIKKSRFFASGMNSAGISIFPGCTANTVQKNVAFGNGTDLFDGNAACDANSWTANVFRTRGQSCIQ